MCVYVCAVVCFFYIYISFFRLNKVVYAHRADLWWFQLFVQCVFFAFLPIYFSRKIREPTIKLHKPANCVSSYQMFNVLARYKYTIHHDALFTDSFVSLRKATVHKQKTLITLDLFRLSIISFFGIDFCHSLSAKTVRACMCVCRKI